MKLKPIQNLFAHFDSLKAIDKESCQQPRPDWAEVAIGLSPPQLSHFQSREPTNLFLAGQGSGKTHTGGVLAGMFIDLAPNMVGLIAANTYGQLTKSTLKEIRQVWADTFKWKEYNPHTGQGCYTVGVRPPEHFNLANHNFDTYRNIISFENGALLYYGSLDNYKALDGMELGWAILDETKDTRKQAIEEVIMGRLRQKGMYVSKSGKITDKPGKHSTPFNPLYMLTSPAKEQWLNDMFALEQHETAIYSTIFNKDDFFRYEGNGKHVTISSTYLNEKNLPANYIDNQKERLPAHLQDMLIYGCPFSKSGGEFYKSFERARHVVNVPYNADLPLHISFDFNVSPYMTCTVWQLWAEQEHFRAAQIDEICLPSPRNSTEAVCKEFKRRYRGHIAGLFVYGDPSGFARDTRYLGVNDFILIGRFLKQYKPSFRVDAKAPPVAMRGNFINSIFEESIDIRLSFAEKCKQTIADYLYLKEAADGTKHKEKAKANGIMYEKYGHTSDANDYFLCAAYRQQFRKYLHGTEKKTSRTGSYYRNPER